MNATKCFFVVIELCDIGASFKLISTIVANLFITKLVTNPNIFFPAKKINPLTHDKHGRKYGDNVSYENINLDYIARLVGEGYPKDIVVRALGITRNDLEMACDILHEFGSKVTNKC